MNLRLWSKMTIGHVLCAPLLIQGCYQNVKCAKTLKPSKISPLFRVEYLNATKKKKRNHATMRICGMFQVNLKWSNLWQGACRRLDAIILVWTKPVISLHIFGEKKLFLCMITDPAKVLISEVHLIVVEFILMNENTTESFQFCLQKVPRINIYYPKLSQRKNFYDATLVFIMMK
jgi:hypothetical protein